MKTTRAASITVTCSEIRNLSKTERERERVRVKSQFDNLIQTASQPSWSQHVRFGFVSLAIP